MKKIIGLICAAAMAATTVTGVFARTAGEYDGQSYGLVGYESSDPDGQFDLAVTAGGDVKIYGDAMYIKGSVYSNGTIYCGDGSGNKIDGLFISGTEGSLDVNESDGKTWQCDGYIHVNDNGTRDGITAYSSKPKYAGAIMDKNTSFECAYAPYTIPEVANSKGEVTANGWWPGAITVKEDTHFTRLLYSGAGMVIDTTNGDVTVVIDALAMIGGNPDIKVKGSNKANIYIKSFENNSKTAVSESALAVYNETANIEHWKGQQTDDNSIKEYFAMLNDPDQINLYIGSATGKMNLNRARISANIKTDVDKFTISGSAKIQGDIEAKGDVVITGGTTYVQGTVCAPESATEVVDSATLFGQLHTDSLLINGTGRIIYNADTGVTAVATAVPTAAPTLEPTVAPTLEPTKSPEVNLPTGDEINLKGSKFAYIFGYEPKFVKTYGADGNVENVKVKIDMAPNDLVTREQVCAMIMRLVDQERGNVGKDYYEISSNLINVSDWAARGVGYICSTGAYNDLTDKISGIGDITRGEVAKLVVFGLALRDKGSVIDFVDVDDLSELKVYIDIMTSNGYMQGDGETFRADDYMTRAEFCSMFNHITDRQERELIGYDEDGNKVEITPATYYITDMDNAPEWQVRECMLATSAFNADGTVDIETRLANIRNVIDNYNSQKEY